MMSWISTIEYDVSQGKLRKCYQRVKDAHGHIDNIMKAHSLRPQAMEGHISLYKNVLHHEGNQLPRWYLEAIGVYVSLINNCHYCVTHHFDGLKELVQDETKTQEMRQVFEENLTQAIDFGGCFEQKQAAGLKYAWQLTVKPCQVDESLVLHCKALGFDDGEILELNQVVAYFNYANRTVLGLGVELEADLWD